MNTIIINTFAFLLMIDFELITQITCLKEKKAMTEYSDSVLNIADI